MAHWGRGRYTQHPRRSIAPSNPESEERHASEGAAATGPQEGSQQTSPTIGSPSTAREPGTTPTLTNSTRLNAALGSATTYTSGKTCSQAKRRRSSTPEAEDNEGGANVNDDMSIPRHPPGKKLRFILPKPSKSKDTGDSRASESNDETERDPEPQQHGKPTSKRALHGIFPGPKGHSKSAKNTVEDYGSGPEATIEGSFGGQFHSGRFKDFEDGMAGVGGLDPSVASLHKKDEARSFSLLKAFMRVPELILALSSHLSVPNLIDLYAISVDFHFIMNSHFTTYIRQNAQRCAPRSDYIFPWRCYRTLTIKDPQGRISESKARLLGAADAADPRMEDVRDVPSLKWLQLVSSRQEVCEEILKRMRESGFSLPYEMTDVLKKIWFTMDLPSTDARIGVMHNGGYWLDRDLFLASLFFVKLDLRFSDPVEGGGELSLRKLMMGGRNLLPLRNLLNNKARMIHVMQLKVWYDYIPNNPEHWGQDIFGVPAQLIGRGCTEGWGRGTRRLIRVDEGAFRENIRRRLPLQRWYLDFIRAGVAKVHKEQKEAEKLEKEKKEKQKALWMEEARKKCLELKAIGDYKGMVRVVERTMDPEWDGNLSNFEETESEDEGNTEGEDGDEEDDDGHEDCEMD